MSTGQPDDSAPLAQDQANRIWQHALHLDTMLFQRGNLFLVAQSLLLVSFTSTLTVILDPAKGRPSVQLLFVARSVAFFGLVLTIVWLYIGHRHLRYYRVQAVQVRAHLPEYMLTRDQWHPRGPSSLPLVTYFLPALSGAIWALMLIITWV